MKFKLITLGIGLVGLILLVVSLFVYNNTRAFIDRSVTTSGAIIDMARERSRNDREYTYYPVVVFETESGQEIEFVSGSGSKTDRDRRGEKVEVLYDPVQPENAEINSFGSLWAGVMVLLVLGIGFVGLGFGGFVYIVINGGPAWVRANDKTPIRIRL